MSEYELVKEVVSLRSAVEELKVLLEQVYAVLDYNIKKGKLEEPKK